MRPGTEEGGVMERAEARAILSTVAIEGSLNLDDLLHDAGYVRAEDIGLVGDIAELYGVQTNTAMNWISRDANWPEPVKVARAGAVYDLSAVRAHRPAAS